MTSCFRCGNAPGTHVNAPPTGHRYLLCRRCRNGPGAGPVETADERAVRLAGELSGWASAAVMWGRT